MKGTTVKSTEPRGAHPVGQSDHIADDTPTQMVRDHLDALLDQIDQGIIVYGTDGHIAFANVAAAHIFGYPAGPDLIRASDDDRMTRVAIFDQFGFPLALTELPGRRV